ncbi:MAG: hypothetical protein V4760_12745 [Bdellovibrionota bacterium]
MASTRNETTRDQRGSGSDINSEVGRLHDDDNLQDKIDEDSFPASDPPSHSPMTGVGRTESESKPRQVHEESERETHDDPSGLKANFKNDKVAQFNYGRRSQASTQHFDTSTERLRKGNPDIGEVDLGTIEADKPAQADDDDLFDSADDDGTTPTDR